MKEDRKQGEQVANSRHPAGRAVEGKLGAAYERPAANTVTVEVGGSVRAPGPLAVRPPVAREAQTGSSKG